MLRATLQSLDTPVMPRRFARAAPTDNEELLLVHSSPLDISALAPTLSSNTVVSLRGLSVADEQDERADDRHWLYLPSLAKHTSNSATKTATSLAKATADRAVDVGGVIADFSTAGATQSVGWFRRRLGFGR
jgi:hypothetical protein